MGLPPEYIPDVNLRLRMYRRLAHLATIKQIEEMEAELADRFGPLPPPARNLMWGLRIKVLAREAGVRTVLRENDQLVLHAPWLERANRRRVQARLKDLAHVGRREVRFPLTKGWQTRLQTVLKRLRLARG
jgi:transcription-repair coupling factor (superfamily II helicase)